MQLRSQGADPTLSNDRGTCALHLMSKRDQLAMAEKCLAKVSIAKQHKVVNAATETGNDYGLV